MGRKKKEIDVSKYIQNYDNLEGSEFISDKLAEMTNEQVRDSSPYNFSTKTFFVTLTPANFRNIGYDNIDFADNTKYDLINDILSGVSVSHNAKIVYSICRSAKGYLHGHAVISYSKNTRYKTVQKDFGKCWVQPVYGSKEQARDYIFKQGKYEEKGEEILFTGGDESVFESIQGQRTDLINFDDAAIQPGFNIDEWLISHISPDNSRDIGMYRTRYEALKRLQAFRTDRKQIRVIYVEGSGGSGKSWGVYKSKGGLFDDNDVCRYNNDEKTAFPLDSYTGQRILHLDELRPSAGNQGISIATLFSLLDPLQQTVNVKNGRYFAAWDTVVITSAFPLDKWFEDDTGSQSDDTVEEWYVRKYQFVRRITEHYYAENYKWVLDKDFEEYKQELKELSDLIVAARADDREKRAKKRRDKLDALRLGVAIDKGETLPFYYSGKSLKDIGLSKKDFGF